MHVQLAVQVDKLSRFIWVVLLQKYVVLYTEKLGCCPKAGQKMDE
jgi:hypothetical protein